MSFIVGPAIQIGTRAGQAASTQISRTLPKTNILDDIVKWFSSFGKTAGPVSSQVTKKATIPSVKGIVSGVSKNVAIGGGTILGTTALLSLTSGGQNLVITTGESVKSISQLGSNVSDFFNKNPLVPIGLIILGGLIVVSVIKK